jgi:hypothetical protein
VAKFDYDDMSATALSLIDEFGQAATWRQIRASGGPKPYDPTGRTVVDFPVTLVFLPVKRIGRETVSQSATEQRKGGVRVFMGQVSGFVPSAKDVIVRGGKELRIASIQETNPAGTPVLYEIELER